MSSDLAAFRSLRTLRALRPLRAISRFEGLKVGENKLCYMCHADAMALFMLQTHDACGRIIRL